MKCAATAMAPRVNGMPSTRARTDSRQPLLRVAEIEVEPVGEQHRNQGQLRQQRDNRALFVERQVADQARAQRGAGRQEQDRGAEDALLRQSANR